MDLTADVAFIDASVADLGFGLGAAPALEALATLAVNGLELRVLGASHQVVLPGGTAETLACAAGLPRVTLPHRHRQNIQVDGRSAAHAMTAERVTGTGPELAARARAATQSFGDHLCVRFAGDPDALTALGARCTPTGWQWETWHVYPQHGEAVRSRTLVSMEGTA